MSFGSRVPSLRRSQSWVRVRAQLSTQHARFQSSDIVYLSTGAGLELLPRALTAAGPKFLEDQFKAKSSGTRCQVSRVTDMAGHEATGPLPFQEEESEFVPIASRSLRFALVSVRYREWN